MRVTDAGSESFVFETSLHGRTMRITIGDVRTWSIKQAHDEATNLKAMTDKGIDPRQDKRELVVASEHPR